MEASNKRGWAMMSSSDESEQTRPVSDKSQWQTRQEQAGDKANKQREQDGYSAVVTIDQDNNNLLNQQSTNNGGRRKR